MSGPTQLLVKRKRSELPADTLILGSRRKKLYRGAADAELRYIRQKGDDETSADTVQSNANVTASQTTDSVNEETVASLSRGRTGFGASSAQSIVERRIFHLNRSSPSRSNAEKAKGKHSAIATFVERKRKRDEQTGSVPNQQEQSRPKVEGIEVPGLKRPGKGAVVRSRAGFIEHTNERNAPAPAGNEADMLGVADKLHLFALDELAKEVKPAVTLKPRLAGSRSRELHHQRVTQREPRIHDEMTGLEDDNDYVFDTYLLAPTQHDGSPQVDPGNGLQSVGFLVISDDDQEIWENYLDDEPSDKDWNTDEDDENAEGHYGAEYPEDELASDDEHDRNAYGYRRHGASDDEEWDENTGTYGDDEHERTIEPWRKKTPAQFANYTSTETDPD